MSLHLFVVYDMQLYCCIIVCVNCKLASKIFRGSGGNRMKVQSLSLLLAIRRYPASAMIIDHGTDSLRITKAINST